MKNNCTLIIQTKSSVMKKLLGILIILSACNANNPGNQEKAKQEVEKAEKDFAQMAADKGIAEAFYSFAAEDATIKRKNDSLIHGKEGIKNFYSAPFYKTATVKWSPDFVDVSSSNDLGYTYGKYVWESKDSTGKVETFKGIFHTVWKKQADGSWKYVWD